MRCHNPEDWAGGLDLTSLDPVHVGDDAASWEKVVRKLRAGMMPPPGKERPPREDSLKVATTLEERLDGQSVPAAAAPALHRLNRAEYSNAIRDLFGMRVDIATLLPPDDASEGFDNVASGLGLSPALIQGYTSAAIKLSRAAVGDMSAGETTTVIQTPDRLAQDKHLEGMPLGSRGGVRIEHDFPLDGEYHFSVRGSFALARSIQRHRRGAGWTARRCAEPARLPPARHRRTARPDGRHIRQQAASGSERHLLRVQGGGRDRQRGNHRAVQCHRSRRYREPAAHLHLPAEVDRRGATLCRTHSGRCGNPCIPRRHSRQADLATVLQFYERGRAEGGFEAGIQQGISRILIDPRFLFRFEAEPEGVAPGAPYPISDLELASRLSFFLWSSIPDAELLDLAARDGCTSRRATRHRCGACWPTARPTRWSRTSPGSGCTCVNSRP